MKTTVTHALKVVAAGATIAVIGLAVTALNAGGEVESSHADVFDFGIFETTPSARFVGALQSLGHEPPRAYRVGEATVYFSARSTPRLPQELVEEYQRKFVEHGVNSDAHLEPQSPLAAASRSMLRGEVLTFAADASFVSMGGGVIAGLPASESELADALAGRGGDSFADVFRGFRTVQAERFDGVTVVTAAWSDDELDIRDTLSPGPPDSVVPACPGCRTMPAFSTLAGDIDRKLHHQESPQTPADVQQFYREALSGRGWFETASSRSAGDQRREYAREDDRLVVITTPTEGGTSVSVIQGE